MNKVQYNSIPKAKIIAVTLILLESNKQFSSRENDVNSFLFFIRFQLLSIKKVL